MKDMKKAPAFLKARRASAYRRACEKAGKPMNEAGRQKIADFAQKAIEAGKSRGLYRVTNNPNELEEVTNPKETIL